MPAQRYGGLPLCPIPIIKWDGLPSPWASCKQALSWAPDPVGADVRAAWGRVETLQPIRRQETAAGLGEENDAKSLDKMKRRNVGPQAF